MTDPAIIAASYSAERNYSHNPDDVIDASDAVGAWGTTKESTTELVDLSGNGNIADIHGAMPTEGFIQGRRFTAANSNYLDCGNDNSLDVPLIVMESIINIKTACNCAIYSDGCSGYSPTRRLDVELSVGKPRVLFSRDGTEEISIISNTILPTNTDVNLCIKYDGSYWTFYINGVLDTTSILYSGTLNSKTRDGYIGVRRSGVLYFDGIIKYVKLQQLFSTSQTPQSFFNTLARLPFWSVNYTDYPDNVTEYNSGDIIPYSSGRVL